MPRPFIPVANTARVDLFYTYQGETVMNVFNVTGAAPFTLATLATLRGVFTTWWASPYRTRFSSALSLYRVRSRALDVESSPYEDYYLPVPNPGTVTGGSNSPGSVTFCVKLNTGLAGRSFRGRHYVPAMHSNMVAGNQATSSFVSNVVSDLNALIAAVNAANAAWYLSVVSYMTGGVYRTDGVSTTITNAVAVDFYIDCQRRRLAGRGI